MNSSITHRKRSLRKILPLTAVLALLALAPTAAFAHTDVFLGVNLGGLFAPAYVPPPAVVYTPRPRAYYYAPAPRVYYYAPRRVYYGHRWHRRERYYRHHHDDHDWHHGRGHEWNHHWRH